MSIDSIASVAAVSAADRVAAIQQAAFEKLKTEPPPRVPFEPAPALRPTVQDRIEIDRALLALREV